MLYTRASPIITRVCKSDHNNYAWRVCRIFARAERPTGTLQITRHRQTLVHLRRVFCACNISRLDRCLNYIQCSARKLQLAMLVKYLSVSWRGLRGEACVAIILPASDNQRLCDRIWFSRSDMVRFSTLKIHSHAVID